MPVYEVLAFTASEAFLENPSILKPAVDRVLAAPGAISFAYGTAEEDKKSSFLLIKWETLQHHKDLIAHAEYPAVLEKLGPVLAGAPTLFHVEFDLDATNAINAPVTEFLTVTPKEGKSIEDPKKPLEELRVLIEGSKGSYPPLPSSVTIEDPNKGFILVGWDSSATHLGLLKTESFQPPLGGLSAVADFQLLHVPLKKTF